MVDVGRFARRRGRAVSSSASSMPETTSTGEVFKMLQTDTAKGEAEIEHVPGNKARLDILKNIGLMEHWFVEKTNLEIGFPVKVLGRGGYGVVVKASYCGAEVAVKMVCNTSAIDKTLVNELRFLRQLRHPNLETFFGVAVHEDTLLVVLEHLAGGTFNKYVSALRDNLHGYSSATMSPCQQQGDAMRDVKVIMRGVLRALVYMHSQKPSVVHCDLKPANIIIITHHGTEPFPKLVDFGLAAASTRKTLVGEGTQLFMAPEVQSAALSSTSAQFGAKAMPSIDIYAVGKLLCYAATLGSLIVPKPGSADGNNPLVQEWTHLIMACLSDDPCQRPTARDLAVQLWQIAPEPTSRSASSHSKNSLVATKLGCKEAL